MLPRSLLSGFSFIALVAASVASTGCFLFEKKTTLADLGPTIARVEVDLDAEPMVHLALPAADGSCEAIEDDVEARVNDRLMDLFKKGGNQPVQGGGWVCGALTFRRALGAEDLAGEKTSFEVADETVTINVEVDGLLAPRTITLSAVDGQMKAGEETQVTWSAAKDELDAADIDVEFVYDDPALVLSAPASLRLEKDGMFVKVPPGSPAGTGTLRLDATVQVPVVVCQGAKSCEAEVRVKTEAPLEILSADTVP